MPMVCPPPLSQRLPRPSTDLGKGETEGGRIVNFVNLDLANRVPGDGFAMLALAPQNAAAAGRNAVSPHRRSVPKPLQ